MNLRRILTALLAGTVLVAHSLAIAAPVARTATVALGNGEVLLPVPDGFADPEVTPALMRKLMAEALPTTNRFIAVMLSQDFLDRRAAGEPVHLTRYLLVQTYRDSEQTGMDKAVFEQVKSMFRKQASEMLKNGQAIAQDGIDRLAKDVGKITGDKATAIKTGPMTSLGVFGETDNSISLATVQPLTTSDKNGSRTSNQVMALSVVLISGKPIGVSVYSQYDSPSDIVWAEDQVRDWVKRINDLNPGSNPD
jgi:hypothetical protein